MCGMKGFGKWNGTRSLCLSLSVVTTAVLIMIIAAGYLMFRSHQGGQQTASSRLLACQGLLTGGEVLPNLTWKPDGCWMHTYSSKEANECLKRHGKNKIVFIGDSNIRFLFVSVLEQLGINYNISRQERHHNHTFHSKDMDLTVLQLWFPVFNITWLPLMQEILQNQEGATMIVSKAGLWNFWRATDEDQPKRLAAFAADFRSWVKAVDSYLDKLPGVQFVWSILDPVDSRPQREGDKLIQPGHANNRSNGENNRQVDLFNDAAKGVLEHSRNIMTWTSGRLLVQSLLKKEKTFVDAVHLTEKPKTTKAQMLLNLYCNECMNFKDDSLCCSPMNKERPGI